MKVLGRARTYAELMAILSERRRALGLTQLGLDHAAELQDGYTGKLEIGAAKRSGRNLGQWSTGKVLRALGLRLVVEEDPEIEIEEITDATSRRRRGQYDRSQDRAVGDGGHGRQRPRAVHDRVDRDAA